MSNEEIKKELKDILKLIDDNIVSAWEDNLEETGQVAILEDFDKSGSSYSGIKPEEKQLTEYNGWYERLKKLKNKL